jgi:hypothetical protein
MPPQLLRAGSNYGIEKHVQRRTETGLQLPVIMLVGDGLCLFAALVEFREDFAFLDLVQGDVESGAG